MLRFNQKPTERLRLTLPFAPRLAAIGATAASIDQVQCDDGILLETPILTSAGDVTVIASGGLDGGSYLFWAEIVTTDGQRLRCDARLRVRGQGVAFGAPVDGGNPASPFYTLQGPDNSAQADSFNGTTGIDGGTP